MTQKTRRSYDPELKSLVITLLNLGQSPHYLSQRFDIPISTIYSWKKTQSDSYKYQKIKKEVKGLQKENDVLKKYVLKLTDEMIHLYRNR